MLVALRSASTSPCPAPGRPTKACPRTPVCFTSCLQSSGKIVRLTSVCQKVGVKCRFPYSTAHPQERGVGPTCPAASLLPKLNAGASSTRCKGDWVLAENGADGVGKRTGQGDAEETCCCCYCCCSSDSCSWLGRPAIPSAVARQFFPQPCPRKTCASATRRNGGWSMR